MYIQANPMGANTLPMINKNSLGPHLKFKPIRKSEIEKLIKGRQPKKKRQVGTLLK